MVNSWKWFSDSLSYHRKWKSIWDFRSAVSDYTSCDKHWVIDSGLCIPRINEINQSIVWSLIIFPDVSRSKYNCLSKREQELMSASPLPVQICELQNFRIPFLPVWIVLIWLCNRNIEDWASCICEGLKYIRTFEGIMTFKALTMLVQHCRLLETSGDDIH